MPHRLAALLVFCVLVLCGHGLASAEPSQTEKTRARQLLDEGDALVEKNDFANALGKYESAHAIMGVPTTGIEVARTLSRLGRLVAARRSAQAVVALPTQVNEPTPFVEARAEAAQLAKQLAGRIPSLQVVFEGVPEGMTPQLFVDGSEVPRSEIGKPRELEPGKHRVEARAGGQTSDTNVNLGEGQTKTVTLRFQLVSSERVHQGKPKEKKAKGTNGRKTAGYVVGGIGIAGLVVAGVTGALVLSRDSDIEKNCPDERCNEKGFDLVEKNRSLLVINSIAWGVGLVGTGVGAYCHL